MKALTHLQMPLVVSWRGLLLALLLFALVSAAAGGITAYWILSRYSLQMPLRAQALQVRLPEQLPVEVEIFPPALDDPALRQAANLQVLPIHIDERFKTVVRVDTRLPIRMNVPYKGDIPVDITLPLKTKVRTRVLGINMELPVEGEIPLRFRLPVDLLIPIEQTLPMKLDLPVETRINQIVHVKIPTRQAARITLQEPSLDVILEKGEIAVPLSWLSLVRDGGMGEETRLGPLAYPPQ